MGKYSSYILLGYGALSAIANLVKLFLPAHPTVAGTICDKVLALGVDVHKLLGA